MKLTKIFFVFTLILIVLSCSKDDDGEVSGDWLIPEDEVQDGGPGKDGIPSVDNPTFIDVSQVSYLNDNDLIVGFERNGVVHGYPHPILDWHEIINDKVSDLNIAIVYCPLTGSATAWDRAMNGTVTTFGVSGLLYNSNLIPYDRASGSNWSQMRGDCVNGDLIGDKVTSYRLIETTWRTFKTMYPDAKIVSDNTGFSRDYTNYPYGDFRTNHNNLLFPVTPLDNRLSAKERVLGVVDKNKVYSINLFADSIRTITDGTTIVCGSRDNNFMVAYNNTLNLTFESVQGSLPIIMTDNEGNMWNVFGEAVSGPRQGERMVKTNSFIGYWFAWGAFYPGISIF